MLFFLLYSSHLPAMGSRKKKEKGRAGRAGGGVAGGELLEAAAFLLICCGLSSLFSSRGNVHFICNASPSFTILVICCFLANYNKNIERKSIKRLSCFSSNSCSILHHNLWNWQPQIVWRRICPKHCEDGYAPNIVKTDMSQTSWRRICPKRHEIVFSGLGYLFMTSISDIEDKD